MTKRGEESIGKLLRIVNNCNSTSAKPAMQPLGDSRATKLDVVAGQTICEYCNKQFKSYLSKTNDAILEIQNLFDAHRCEREDSAPKR